MPSRKLRVGGTVLAVLGVLGVLVLHWMVFFWTPTEASMGVIQRIFYIHMGCNIGAFFATVTNGDPSGWLFGLGMTGGGWIGVTCTTPTRRNDWSALSRLRDPTRTVTCFMRTIMPGPPFAGAAAWRFSRGPLPPSVHLPARSG